MSGSNGWLSLDACTSCSLNDFLPYNLFLYYGGYAAFLITFLYCLESASVFARTARLMVRPRFARRLFTIFLRLARRFSTALLLFEILLYLEVTIQGRRPASFQPVRENLL